MRPPSPRQADHVFDAHPCAVLGLAVLPRTTPSMTLFVTSAADCVMRVWDYGRRRLVCRRTFVALSSLSSSLSSDVGQGSPLVDADGDECVPTWCMIRGGGCALSVGVREVGWCVCEGGGRRWLSCLATCVPTPLLSRQLPCLTHHSSPSELPPLCLP